MTEQATSTILEENNKLLELLHALQACFNARQPKLAHALAEDAGWVFSEWTNENWLSQHYYTIHRQEHLWKLSYRITADGVYRMSYGYERQKLF